MIHIISFLIQSLATIIFLVFMAFPLVVLSLIFWDGSFFDIGEKILDTIWEPKE